MDVHLQSSKHPPPFIPAELLTLLHPSGPQLSYHHPTPPSSPTIIRSRHAPSHFNTSSLSRQPNTNSNMPRLSSYTGGETSKLRLISTASQPHMPTRGRLSIPSPLSTSSVTLSIELQRVSTSASRPTTTTSLGGAPPVVKTTHSSSTPGTTSRATLIRDVRSPSATTRCSTRSTRTSGRLEERLLWK